MRTFDPNFRPPNLTAGIQRWGLVLIAGLLLVGLFVGLQTRSNVGSAPETAAAIAAPVPPAADVAALTPNQVAALLLRSGSGPNDVPLDILYAPTWYFAWNRRSLPQTDGPVLVFFVMETIHEDVLASEPPLPLLRIGDRQIEPLEFRVVSDAPHHRVSQALFSALGQAGQPLVTEESERLTLVVPVDGLVSGANTFTWDLPLPYGLGLVNALVQAETPVAAAPGRPFLTWSAFLAIMGGMLAALSPCLLQLAAYYAAVLAGAGAEAEHLAHARRHLLRVGLFFAAGFTLIYTAGGALAGYVGGSLQGLGFIQQWSRPVSIVAGGVILLLAIRVAIQARAPLVCRLPLRVKPGSGSGWLSSMLMGSTFAVGCLSCFSATVLTALLLYAGSTGSPLTGALLLLLFSSGVSAVFLLAAWVVGEAAPMMDWLQRAQPIIGGVSALVMAGFGLLMLTYQFHTVSGFLLRLFSPG